MQITIPKLDEGLRQLKRETAAGEHRLGAVEKAITLTTIDDMLMLPPERKERLAEILSMAFAEPLEL